MQNSTRISPTARDCIDGNVPHEKWPATMDEFYARCTEDDLVTILLRSCYADPWAHYHFTIGEHVRAILRSVRRAAAEKEG